jgi:hypothetical protein
VLVTPPQCTNEEFAFAPGQALGRHCLRVFRVETGQSLLIPLVLNISGTHAAFRFLIWIGSDQERTFGPTITGLIYKNIEPERMILWDSKKRGGRPDSVQLLKDTWKSFGAEVIFITSNKQGNDEMMQGCREGQSFSHDLRP